MNVKIFIYGFGVATVLFVAALFIMSKQGCGTTTYLPQMDSIAVYKDSLARVQGRVDILSIANSELDSLLRARQVQITKVSNSYYSLSVPQIKNPDSAYLYLKGVLND